MFNIPKPFPFVAVGISFVLVALAILSVMQA
jgi:hypothetical protein